MKQTKRIIFAAVTLLILLVIGIAAYMERKEEA